MVPRTRARLLQANSVQDGDKSMNVTVSLQRLAKRVLLPVMGAALLSMTFVPVPAQAGPASISWGNVACDPSSAQLPDPAVGPQQCAYIQVPLDYRNPGGQQ